jgi:hypothetical protein
MARSASHPKIRPVVTTVSLVAVSVVSVLFGPFGAVPAQADDAAQAPGAVRPATTVSVTDLRSTGARTDITVRGLRRTAQARWVDQVVEDRLVSIDGCLADPARFRMRSGTYRSHVNTLCAGGVAQARRAAAALVADKPWYRVTVREVPVVAFTLQADLEVGRGEPFAAAYRHLPHHGFTYVEGDDVWMAYVGTGVTQTQLDAARAAFAAELRISADRVTVAPLRF